MYDSVPREDLWTALEKLGIPEEVISIVRSFHENKKARIRVDGELLEEIEVENGLRQGCTMAPSLFNLYARVVAERWLHRVSDIEGVGTYLLYKYDQNLFRRNTRGASNSTLYECEFADDVALLATTRTAAEKAIKTYTSVASSFGMTVNIQKTKFMVVGSGIEDEDLQPIVIEGGEIENVKEFSYLGSLIAENGRIDTKVDKRIANVSKAFGALHQAVFKGAHLSIYTKRKVYQACVLSALMYGGECWTPLRKHLKKMNTFHHRCIHTVLGITNKRQWEERLSSEKVKTITEKLMKRRLD